MHANKYWQYLLEYPPVVWWMDDMVVVLIIFCCFLVKCGCYWFVCLSPPGSASGGLPFSSWSGPTPPCHPLQLQMTIPMVGSLGE
jgi:hypothetical protein